MIVAWIQQQVLPPMEVTPKAAVSSSDDHGMVSAATSLATKPFMGMDQQAAMEKEGEEH